VGSPTAGYGQPAHQVPVARAVAASSCFPPVFHPMPISALGHLELSDGRVPDGPARDASLARMSLTDGGVFDNLGVTPVWDTYEHLIVSNGGAVFEPQRQYDPLGLLLRYIAVTGNGGEWMRTKIIRENDRAGRFDGALWDIADEILDPDIVDYRPSVVEKFISNVRTDLDVFSDVEQGALENRGYAVAENALVRQLARPNALSMRGAPFVLPCPEVDGTTVEREMTASHERRLFGHTRWWG
jgi:NTE family protein